MVKIRHATAAHFTLDSSTDGVVGGDRSSSEQMIAIEVTNIGEQEPQKIDSSNQTQTVSAEISSLKAQNMELNIDEFKNHPTQYLTGYESESQVLDPNSLQFQQDVADSLSKQELRSKGWQAKRFKRFPRFSIYLHRDKTNSHLERNYISLNNRMLSYLAEPEPKNSEI